MEKNNQVDLIKIAIVGPESTGKSTIAAYLAKEFETIWVKEFSRAYCEKITHNCSIEDELNIFYGQLASENKAILDLNEKKNSPILICDTTIITVKIWCEHVFGFCPQEVQTEFETREYDLYLLMKDDIEWEEDPLRNFPNDRPYFFKWYHDLLLNGKLNFVMISGEGQERKNNAKKAVKAFLKISL